MKTTTLAYMAGTIDSDGCIGIQKTRKNVKGNKCGPVTYFYPKLAINQITEAIPRLFSDSFGGPVFTHTPKNPRHNPVFIWNASNTTAVSTLKLLLPYLILKRRQAELAVELGELIVSQWATIKSTTTPPYRIPAVMNEQRERLWAEAKALNLRGHRKRP